MAQKNTLNPHESIVLVCIYSFFVGFSQSLHVGMLVPLLPEIILKRHHILNVLKKLFFLNAFVFVLFISVYFQDPALAILIALRANLIMFFSLLFFSSFDYFDIALGLNRLYIPKDLVNIFYFSSKFIYLLFADIKSFNQTLLLRGGAFKSNMYIYRIYANFIGRFFIKAFERSEKLNNALLLRGYKGSLENLDDFKENRSYFIFISSLMAISICMKVYL